MRTALVLVVVTLLLSPLALGAPQSAEKGLSNACDRAKSEKPCAHLGLIPETVLGTDETRTYANRTYTAEGTVTIGPGATVIVDNATIVFTEDSHGFIVQSGGTLIVKSSRLLEGSDGSPFGIDAQAASTLSLTTSEVVGGTGVAVATEDAELHHNRLAEIAVALRLTGVSLEVHHNHFEGNTVSANNTGGAPTYHNNTFQGGDYCIRDWYTDPVIRFNVFLDCHVGIWHERSESTLSDNTMEDSAAPPGGGIVVMDTMSPLIERNNISMYGTGILIVNARAYVRDNVIHHNVGAGVRIVGNSAPMDIQRNHIYGNGGAGISLDDVSDMIVSANDVGGNGGHGIQLAGASNLNVSENVVRANGLHGIVVETSPGTVLRDNHVLDHPGDGIAVLDSNGTEVAGGSAVGNGGNGYAFVRAHGSGLVDVVATGNGVGVYAGQVSGLGLAAALASGSAYGFLLENVSALEATDLDATGNGVGFWLLNTSGALADANASANGDGFRTERVWTTATAGPPTLDLISARAFDNTRYGLYNVAANATSAQGGWWEGNAVAGVANDGDGSFDARYSYWGSPNGPTHPDNEGGDGDAVLGDVLYEPYLTAPPGTLPPGIDYGYIG